MLLLSSQKLHILAHVQDEKVDTVHQRKHILLWQRLDMGTRVLLAQEHVWVAGRYLVVHDLCFPFIAICSCAGHFCVLSWPFLWHILHTMFLRMQYRILTKGYLSKIAAQARRLFWANIPQSELTIFEFVFLQDVSFLCWEKLETRGNHITKTKIS